MIALLLSLIACQPTDQFQETTPTTDSVWTGIWAEEVWAVSGGAGGLAWDRDTLIATAELGDTVLRWDPLTDQEEEIGNRLGGSPTSVAVDASGTIFLSVTDSGVEGFVGVLEGLHDYRILASSAGTALFRRPVDLALAPDGSLTVADSGAEAIWRVPLDGGEAEVLYSGVECQALTWHQGSLYVATEDRVLQQVDGALETEVEAEFRDLVSWNGQLLGTTPDGLAQVADGVMRVPLDAGRPGAVTLDGNRVFIADDSGGRIWQADLEPGDD